VIEVPWKEACRFGIMNATDNGNITEFEEKPTNPQSNLASMGIYIFNWSVLKAYLSEDANSLTSSHDFGKDIIPKMLSDNRKLFAYPFAGYWKDVGTVQSFWEANMDLLAQQPSLKLNEYNWRIYSVHACQSPQYISPHAQITDSLINEGCLIYGAIHKSILFHQVGVGRHSHIEESVIMPNAKIGQNVKLKKVIVAEGVTIPDYTEIVSPEDEILVIDKDTSIRNQATISS
jgi:glucose-1-phosphate adenylyltransferase